MTIVAAWERRVSKTTELVIASDSMLSGGMRWDCGPKLFPLHRGDAVIAFAGATQFAYPIVMQLLNWSEDYERAKSRAQDLTDMKGHMERACQAMLERVDADPKAFDWRKDFRMLLVGYSWKFRKFYIWASKARNDVWKLEHPSGTAGAVFIGDHVKMALETHARRTRLGDRRSARHEGGRRRNVALDWEPLDTIVEMIRKPEFDTIGGAPQVVKVYRHLNTAQYAIEWEGALTLRGRRLLDYEHTQRLVLNLETKRTLRTWRHLPKPEDSTEIDENIDAGEGEPRNDDDQRR
jgi:hypothetical protein